jgi:hypothetical protein
MILRKVALKNFLIHEDTQLEFSPNGITAIIVKMGPGKVQSLKLFNLRFLEIQIKEIVKN